MALPDVEASELQKHYEGDIFEFESVFVQGRLDEVVDKIESRWGSRVAARLADGSLKLRLYNAVVCRVVARVLRNPEGYQQENEGQYGYKVSAAVASGTIWFTDADEEDLTGVSKSAPRLPGTIRVNAPRRC